MKSIPSSRKKYLDGEFLYDYYFRVMGTAKSTQKLPAVCAERGMVNSVTGKPPGQMACWKAIWLWACKKENHQKAYQIYNEFLSSIGQFISFEEFKDLLRRYADTANQFPSQAYKIRYLKRNDL
jgi:hypothetical protein